MKRDWGQGTDDVILARMPLHAHRLILSIQDESIEITSEMPRDFLDAMEASIQYGDDMKPGSTPAWRSS